MTSREELLGNKLSEEEIDQLVEAQAEDAAAWDHSVRVSPAQNEANRDMPQQPM